MTILERIYAELEKQNIKAVRLCEYLGITTSVLSTWKKRGTEPKAIYIQPIAEFLGVSERYLLTGDISSDNSSTAAENVDTSESISDRIFDTLTSKELKARDMALFIGTTEGVVSAWKKRGTIPKAIYLKKISEFLGVSEEYLLTGKKECENDYDITADLDNLVRKIKAGKHASLKYNGIEIDEETLQLLESSINMSLRVLNLTEKANPNKR